MTKERYGKLTVIKEYIATKANGKRERVSECRCDCGNVMKVEEPNE